MKFSLSRKILSLTLLTIFTGVAVTPGAAAAESLKIVHREKVKAGPYDLSLGFTRWPLKEGQSFDLTIDPVGGISGKTGTLTMMTPTGRPAAVQGFSFDKVPMSRHPRQRQSWGLDVQSFTDTGSGGRWSMAFTVDGPQGKGEGRLAVLPFEPLPGPSQILSWLLSAVPLLLISVTIGIGWFRLRPGRQPGAWSLTAPTNPVGVSG